MNKNYIKLDVFSLMYNHYVFIDTDEYLADKLFIDYEVKVEFGKEYIKEDSSYVVIFCKVRKGDDNKFQEALGDLHNKMLLMGHADYNDECGMLIEMAA